MPTQSDRFNQYGITEREYDGLLRDDGTCWICEEQESIPGRSLAIDHDHVTGQVRGLLCTRCNQVLGRMKDNPAWLRRAADYLDGARMVYADDCDDCRAERSVAYKAGDFDFATDEMKGACTPPCGIVDSDGSWTRFAYQCTEGHQWTCGWATFGLPKW